ncbi:hypothetical protein PTSG_06765 [Salpingoeca rosetta]|uniref:Uncharacterized protein n=1 Tax=Salpingoeca rosetta (strain ATCC 50818 / BSB-021) TaxID=946362 RepID=F2UER0_SALR5|nr:uncharacterized protein PTSG_06765 [Salpingoeca rosetta]EGD75110.1 hypothetical protein PTSG_06765 [Salpingoeca rosetta]|eukprot:XP_004992163.1 hypothetical protein PTSG_06765 [Salpingoeca rosetta]
MLLTHQEEEDKDNPLEAVTVVGVADAQDAGVGGISPEPDCEDDTPHSHRRQPTQQQEQGSEAYQPLFTGPSPQHMSLSTVLWPQFNALSTVYREASTRFTRTLQRSKQSLTSCWEDTILFVSSSLKLTGDKNRDKNSTTESTALASNGCAKLGGLSSLVRELVSTWTVPSMPVVSVAPVLPHTQHFQAEVDVQQDLQQDLQQRQSIQHRQQYRGHEHRRKISDSGFWEDWPDEVGVDDLHNHRQPQQHQQPHQHQPQYPFTSFNDTTDYLQPLITIDSLYNTTDTAGSGVATPPVEPATNAAAQTASIMGQSPPPPRELPAPAQRTESNALSAAAMHGTGTQPYDDFSGQLDWPACDDIQSFLFDSGPTSLTTGSSTLDSTAWRPLLRTSSSSSSSSSSSASWPSNEHGGLQQRQHKRRRTRHCRAFPPPPRVYEEYGAYMAAFMAASPRDKEKMLRDRRLTTDRYAQLRYWAKRVDPTHHAVLGAYRTRMNNRKNKRHQRQRERAASTAKSRSRNPMPNLALKELAATIQGGGVGWSSGPSMFPVARSPQASPFFEPWQAQTASSFFGFANTPGTRTGRSQSSRPNPLDQELPPCDPQWLPPRSRFPQEQQEAEEFAMAFDVPMM